MGNSSTSPQPAASVPDADQLHKVLLAMKHTSYEMQAKSEASKEEEDAEIASIESSLRDAVRSCHDEMAKALARSLLMHSKNRHSKREATLANSLADLAQRTAQAISSCGADPFALPILRALDGVGRCLSKAVGPDEAELYAALVVLDAQLTAAGVPALPQMAGGDAKADSILSQMPLPPTATPQRRVPGAGRPPDRP